MRILFWGLFLIPATVVLVWAWMTFGQEAFPWATFIAVFIPGLFTVAGWDISNYYRSMRDREAKKREIITQHLIKSYIRIAESTARDFDQHPEKFLRLEFAIRDILLFGTTEQITLALEIAESIRSQFDDSKKSQPTSMDNLLLNLRYALRVELGLDGDSRTRIPVFRFDVRKEAKIVYPIDELEK